MRSRGRRAATRSYDFRFFSGEYRLGELFGTCIQIIRGNDDRRSFLGTDFRIYTEEEAGGLDNGGTLSLDDEVVTPDDDWHYPEDAEGEGADGGHNTGVAGSAGSPVPVVEAEIVEAKPKAAVKRVRKPRAKAPAGKAKTAAKKPVSKAKKTSK